MASTVFDDISSGYKTSLAIGTDGLPLISFCKSSGNLWLGEARCGTPGCTGNGVTLSGGVDLGSSTSYWEDMYSARYWGRGFQLDSTTATATDPEIFDLNITTSQDSTVGFNLKYESEADAGADTLYAMNLNLLNNDDASANDTLYGLNISAAQIDSGGTLYGINLANLASGAGTEYGLYIGTGWDYPIYQAGSSGTNIFNAVTQFGTLNLSSAGAERVGTDVTFNPTAGGIQYGYNLAITNAPTVAANTAHG
jgi:hypothetical protein